MSGGFGGEGYGDPMGGGGGLHLVRAIAVGGQVVRAVFNKAPKTRSPAANNDGLNGANYALTITTGSGVVPLCVGACRVVPFPAFGVLLAGEVGIDIQTDRHLVVGLAYTLTASPRVLAADGDTMGFPYTQPFVGAARPQRTRQSETFQGAVDFNSGPDGLIVSNGDIETVSGIPSCKLRCMRRTTTMKGTFAHLPGYGAGFQPKAPMTASRMAPLRADLIQQLKSEPDVQDASVTVSTSSTGAAIIDERIKNRKNQAFTLTVSGPNS